MVRYVSCPYGPTIQSILDLLPVPPERQADATISISPPNSGQRYTLLDTTQPVRIYGISIQCTWTVQPTPLELHMTLDGNYYLHFRNNPASATPYFPRWRTHFAPTTHVLDTTDGLYSFMSFLAEARSATIEAEITGGTVSNLAARIMYGLW